MQDFLVLLEKIYPLYIIVGLGFIAGRYLKVDRTTISSLLIYLIAPAVVFYGVAGATNLASHLLIPLVFYISAVTLSLTFYALGGLFWRTGERNLLGFMAGSSNTGYFGIPLVLSIFGQPGLSIAVFATIGLILYESTRGYYIMARSHATMAEAFKKVLKLPVLYAATAGVAFNLLGLSIPQSLGTAFGYFSGAYTVLGMMILGIGLATATRAAFDKSLVSLSFLAKFVAYPLIISLFVYLDVNHFRVFDPDIHKIMLILSITPMATNAVTYATALRIHPEKVSSTVLLSTLFALIYIPAFIAIFLS